MAAATTSARRSGRRRGRTSAHSPEGLLELVARVAQAAAREGQGASTERVSMPVFNAARVEVDRADGITAPAASVERTPTAEAIQARFKALAGRPVPWSEVVAGALRPARDRVMWLAALRREEARDDLTDELVIHALQLVSRRAGLEALAVHEYADVRDRMVAEDKATYGKEGQMEYLLPTANQVLAHCGLKWENATRLAGLKARAQPQHGGRPRAGAVPGTPVAVAIAMFAAVNDRWPSKPVLLHFATKCGIRLADMTGPMGPSRAEAARLLKAEGVTPPGPPKALGKGKRLTYRYPVHGIPGATLRDRGRRGDQLVENPRLEELRRELAVLSLRVWLAGLSANDPRSRSAYLRWQVGSGWMPASAFDKKGRGGFSRLKQQADDENSRVRRAGGDALAAARKAGEAVKAEMAEMHRTGTVRRPEPVPFGEALRAVLADPHAEAQPPKQ